MELIGSYAYKVFVGNKVLCYAMTLHQNKYMTFVHYLEAIYVTDVIFQKKYRSSGRIEEEKFISAKNIICMAIKRSFLYYPTNSN